MHLTGRPILITDGTSGIGRGLAKAVHQLGNHVVIAGRRQALIDEITEAHPGMHGLQPMTDLTSLRLAPPPTRTAQDRQNAFLNAATDRRTVAADRVAAPASPNILQGGAVISAALITGIRSDLPGRSAPSPATTAS